MVLRLALRLKFLTVTYPDLGAVNIFPNTFRLLLFTKGLNLEVFSSHFLFDSCYELFIDLSYQKYKTVDKYKVHRKEYIKRLM